MKRLIGKFLDATFLRFLLVGAVNTLVGTGVMFALYNLAGCGYWFSSAMNYVVGSVVSYFLNKYFTFKRTGRDAKMVLRFIVNISVCYAVAYGAARPLARQLLAGAEQTVRDNVAMLFGMCLFVGLNYLGQRILVFRADEPEPDAAAREDRERE